MANTLTGPMTKDAHSGGTKFPIMENGEKKLVFKGGTSTSPDEAHRTIMGMKANIDSGTGYPDAAGRLQSKKSINS